MDNEADKLHAAHEEYMEELLENDGAYIDEGPMVDFQYEGLRLLESADGYYLGYLSPITGHPYPPQTSYMESYEEAEALYKIWLKREEL